MMNQDDGRQLANDEELDQPAMDASLEPASSAAGTIDPGELISNLTGWRDELTDTLEQMSADGFQRLILQLLGKDGVGQIELSSTNDTIEGIGIFGGGGFLTFRVSFRCIRGGGRISSAEVDDFRRGVMLGRADKGLLITTGSFTQEAALKAASDRTPEIKLIDGEELIGKLKDLELGVRAELVTVERVVIDREWFAAV
ncbi:MAG: restriction endonuclease [Chloroflexota bacterium]|nr:restriction endonuclease [Chloroflexota bacterium]